MSINRDFSAFFLFPRKRKKKKKIWDEMLFVKNGGFHRASNIIVIEAVSFLFSNISKLALPPFCCLSDRHSSREKKGRVVGFRGQ